MIIHSIFWSTLSKQGKTLSKIKTPLKENLYFIATFYSTHQDKTYINYIRRNNVIRWWVLLILVSTQREDLWQVSWWEIQGWSALNDRLGVIVKAKLKKYSSAIILVLRYKHTKFLKFHYCWKQSRIEFEDVVEEVLKWHNTSFEIQRVPINIVHGEINHFLKSRSD